MTRLALSIQQPWAWLIVNGYKPLENRDWPTRVRQRIDIHASKKFDDEGYRWVCRNFPTIEMLEHLPFDQGGIVGSAELMDCVTVSESPWFMGRYGFVFRKPEPCKLIPLRGQLGFFAVPEGTPLTLLRNDSQDNRTS